ncbi:hypothetical protein DEA8626_02069 [Defluviimonas aquaemixtae]|uniref:DUF4240 domain-containing protein n=1 Tax=Albidovulum aquaemixtae TaxID=1542388 RepID=A0A2R8B7H7_9RHOB|nr:DUF4240 domain-containing protein [Defluviimonas aquaemixtae]SPH18530.1 hypothetical protein DEA8626_02069 [Defluviimonas aquaemixtae]
MDYKDGLVTGFKPKFRSFDDDWERYMFAVVDLEEAGKITCTPGVPLYASHCGPGYDWLIDQYFEAGKRDEIEAYFTPSGETFYAPLTDSTLAVLERFRAMGEGARAVRIWRAHTCLMKGVFWFYVNERRKGFRYEPGIMNVSEAEQRASHEDFVGQIPEKKAILLKAMADFRALAAGEGGSASELARIDVDIAAIEAEERPKPVNKTDARKMTEDVFWELIDTGLGIETLGERLDLLPERLAQFKPSAIRAFDKILREMDARAYRTDVWALAYLLQGGCSDDAFDAFRGWLILQGRAVFEATLADPDGFDIALHHGSAGGMDALRDAAPIAYDMREGRAMPPAKSKLLKLAGPEVEEHDFPSMLPRIAAAVEAV